MSFYQTNEIGTLKNAHKPASFLVDATAGGSGSHLEPLRVSKDYCCFCGDFMQKKNLCIDCGAYMCEQSIPFGSGCIAFETISPKKPFYCVLCDVKRWRQLPGPRPPGGLPVSRCLCISPPLAVLLRWLQYRFEGYSGRKRAKLTWPLVIVNMTLSTSFEKFISDSLNVDFGFQYIAARQNVSEVSFIIFFFFFFF